MGTIGQIHPRYQVDAKIDAVSPLFAKVRAQYGAAFNAALGRETLRMRLRLMWGPASIASRSAR